MCDTMVSLTRDGVLFAKNSDRDPNEAQTIEWYPAADHAPGTRMRATWIRIDQVPRTHGVLIARPWWMWGAEMGANEHGLVIGNEAVFTRESLRGERGLLGMDLLRLALERATTADGAVEVIVSLLERHGQVGPCSHEHPGFSYHNSFLIADPDGAVVLETAGRSWATEQVTGPGRSISNGLTIPGFAERYADRLRGRVAACEVRRRLTQDHASAAEQPGDLFRALRDNGGGRDAGGGPRWSPINGSMRGPNLHAGGLLASSQTVNSWVSDLRANPLHWATGTSDPAFSLFLPFRVDQPAELGPVPTNRHDPAALWWRHEPLHRLALRHWAASEVVVAGERDETERRWLAEPPSTTEALAEAERLRERWGTRLARAGLAETRPWWLRRQWAAYDRAAGLSGGAA